MNYIDIFTTDMEADADTPKMLMLQFLGALPLLLLVVLVFESGLILKPIHPDMGRGIITHTIDMPYGDPEQHQVYHFGIVWLFIAIAYLALLGSFVITFIQTAAQKYTTPVKAMLIFQFEPVVATISAVIIFQEAFTGLKVAGCLVIIGGVLLSELGPMIFSSRKTPEGANPEPKSS